MAAITVIPPQITAVSLAAKSFCAGQSVNLMLTLAGKFPTNNQFIVQLSDQAGKNFTILPMQISGISLTVQLPTTLELGTNYRFKIISSATAGEIISEAVSVVSPPQPPQTAAVSFCQNSSATALKATGKNLKWYLSGTDTRGSASVIPPTTTEGKLIYYVSQSDPIGCESKRATIEVTIAPIATAIISGDRTILKNDSTEVKISLTGDSPWDFTLSNNKKYTSTANNYFVYVKPLQSTTYTLQSVKNTCGFGKIYGSAKIAILVPLAVAEEEKDVSIYPNPVNDQLIISLTLNESEVASLVLADANGKSCRQKTIMGIGTPQQEYLDCQELAGGIYYLKIDSPKRSIVRKIVKL